MATSFGQASAPVYIQAGLNEPHIKPYDASESVVNSTILKMLLPILVTSNSKNSSNFEARKSYEAFGELLEMNSQYMGNPVFERSNMGSELQRMSDIFNNAERSNSYNGATLKYKTIYIEEECSRALEDIRHEIEHDRIMAKFAHRKLIAVIHIHMAKVAEGKDELEQDNGNRSENGKFTTGTSYAELWASIANAIQAIKEDYVDFYADLMKQYTDMYEAYNNYVQKASSDAVSAGKDGNTVGYDSDVMWAGYTNFDNYVNAHTPAGNVKNWDKMTEKEKDDMRSTLEPAYHVDKDGVITFNLDQYNNSVNGSHPSTSTVENGIGYPSTASYQAWLATFNSAGSALQSNMQSFAQRYSQANSMFDNLNKVLSGAISSLGESAKDVFKSL
ncbi:IpaD/SipD/SspD family type III secretion system needle tip protein [Pectobacterium brasiliense]|nr:IpaD/SipD/SspD family type III secretion system needle tip protein [Pectobacterium brasiliense]